MEKKVVTYLQLHGIGKGGNGYHGEEGCGNEHRGEDNQMHEAANT